MTDLKSRAISDPKPLSSTTFIDRSAHWHQAGTSWLCLQTFITRVTAADMAVTAEPDRMTLLASPGDIAEAGLPGRSAQIVEPSTTRQCSTYAALRLADPAPR